MEEQDNNGELDAMAITRPDASLLTYYLLVSICALIAFPFVFIPLFIKYKTMRYRFDESGVSMSWGFFFRREVQLTYARLQDIHVTRNIIERWIGLAKLPIQTASGSSGATMVIEGIREAEPLREFLYVRMRGARGEDRREDRGEDNSNSSPQDTPVQSEATEVLRQIRDELRLRNQEKL